MGGLDRETNFDRLAFNPRRTLRLPLGIGDEGRSQLHARLLECWLRAPLSFLFVFYSTTNDFKVVVTTDMEAMQRQQGLPKVFQRLKGWVLCDKEGLCLVSLRETQIHWYENRRVFEIRDSHTLDKKLYLIDKLRTAFFSETSQVLAAFGVVAEASNWRE